MARRPFPRLVLFVTVFLDLAGLGMILPLLPFYAERYGADALGVGILFGSYSLAQAMFAPVLGRLSDRFGRRPVLLAAIALNVGALLMFAAARSFGMMLVARTLSGVAAANFSIAQAYVADVTPPERRAGGLGLIGAALGMGFVVGPGIGGLLSFLGHVAVPLGAAAFSFLNLLLVAVALPESRAPEARDTRRGAWFPLARIGRLEAPLGGLMALFFVVVFAFATMEATIALYCERRFEFDVADTSWLFVFIGVVIAVVQGGLVGRLVARFGERRLVVVGIATMAFGLLAVPLAPTVLLLFAAGSALAVGSGLNNPSLLGIVSRLASDAEQGATLGVARAMGSLARTAGPIWGGWVFDRFGPASPFFTAAAVMAVALAAAAVLVRRLPPRMEARDGTTAEAAAVHG